ncbi:hypothetical protein [Campylobacter insulaenigrae]|uniref:hypothetical protein n=1 Tax=Campylobacter insulaenigrae TaxID=260714 RepID=UPI00215243FC|nr:hypothetical protein [Campylobacter insulaenigrae]MCR6577673.1 hypothetical protein [Campylobacter insulaenigrae]
MKNIILAARGDAIGERLCCLLNAMFISKKTDLNFGFVWAQTPKIENNTQNSLVIKMASDLYKYNQEDFFSQDFIKQYSYKDVFNLGNGNFSKFKNQSIKNMNDKALYQNSWGYYCVQDELDVYFNDIDDYRECIRLCWNEIKFSCKIQKIIDSAYDLLISDFIAIHVRGGDALYDLREIDCYIGAFKIVPLELAINIIKNTSKNKNIILFGDDISSNCKIKKYCSGNKVFLIDDFFDRTSMDSVEQAIFEMVVMSRAEVIYSSGASGFSRLAFLIGLSKKVYLSNISYKDRYFNILHYIDDFYANNFQKAFSYLYLFLISRELNYDYETQIEYLEKSKTQDSKNNVYKVLLSDLYIKNGSYDKLIELLHNIDHKFFNIFFKRGFSTQKYLAYDFVFKSFLKNEFNSNVINYIKYLIVCKFFNKEIPLSHENQVYVYDIMQNLNFNYFYQTYILNENRDKFIAIFKELLFYKFELNNKNINKNYNISSTLSYKLGDVVIKNYTDPINFLKLPFLLYIAKKIYVKKNLVQNNNVNILKYKLGQIIIKAHKNWYKGGYIKFWYDLYKLRKEYKNRKS